MCCRAVHLTSVHFAFDTRIFYKECKSLAMAGFDVTLVAPHAEGDTVRDGVKLVAVRPPTGRRERVTTTIGSVYRAALRARGDVYHFHDPELMPVGVLLKAHGKRVIYDVHEDYPQTILMTEWIRPVLRRAVSAGIGMGEMAASLAYDRVIAATPTIAARFPAAKTQVIQNFPWRDELRLPESNGYAARKPVCVYVGRLSNSRGLQEMAQAIQLASSRLPAKLVTAGDAISGAGANLEIGRGTGLVEHRGLQSRSEVAALLAGARIGLAVMHPLQCYIHSHPTKLYEYMSAGLPVVVSDFPVWREIVDSAKCGLLVNPLDTEAIAEAIVWLLSHPAEAEQMGRNGRRAVVEVYNWEQESTRLTSIYSELLAAKVTGAQALRKPAADRAEGR